MKNRKHNRKKRQRADQRCARNFFFLRSKELIIIPTGGLGNRLRVLLSYLSKANKEHKKLIVLWRQTPACPGLFYECFKHISNVEVNVKYKLANNVKVCYYGCHQNKKYLINANSLIPIIVTMTLRIPTAIFAEAFLSFLGLGLQPPIASYRLVDIR